MATALPVTLPTTLTTATTTGHLGHHGTLHQLLRGQDYTLPPTVSGGGTGHDAHHAAIAAVLGTAYTGGGTAQAHVDGHNALGTLLTGWAPGANRHAYTTGEIPGGVWIDLFSTDSAATINTKLTTNGTGKYFWLNAGTYTNINAAQTVAANCHIWGPATAILNGSNTKTEPFAQSATALDLRGFRVTNYTTNGLHVGTDWNVDSVEVDNIGTNSGQNGVGINHGNVSTPPLRAVITNCLVHDNGNYGFTGNSSQDCRVSHCDIYHNNTLNVSATNGAGAGKWVNAWRCQIDNNHCWDNNGVHIWADIACRDFTIEWNKVEQVGAFTTQDLVQNVGIMWEISGGAIIRYNRVTGSRNRGIYVSSSGVASDYDGAMTQVQAYGNTVKDCGLTPATTGGIAVERSSTRGYGGVPWTNPFTDHIRIHDNHVSSGAAHGFAVELTDASGSNLLWNNTHDIEIYANEYHLNSTSLVKFKSGPYGTNTSGSSRAWTSWITVGSSPSRWDGVVTVDSVSQPAGSATADYT